jgi:hypothetical protein
MDDAQHSAIVHYLLASKHDTSLSYYQVNVTDINNNNNNNNNNNHESGMKKNETNYRL